MRSPGRTTTPSGSWIDFHPSGWRVFRFRSFILGYTTIVEAERSKNMSDPDTDVDGTDATESPAFTHDPARETFGTQFQPPLEDEEELEPTIVLGRE